MVCGLMGGGKGRERERVCSAKRQPRGFGGAWLAQLARSGKPFFERGSECMYSCWQTSTHGPRVPLSLAQEGMHVLSGHGML